MRIFVVIPCKSETQIERAIRSLFDETIGLEVYIIVVVNSNADDAPHIHAQNKLTLTELSELQNRLPLGYKLEIISDVFKEPAKAGVGLARKIGMDKAAALASDSEVIVCYDADCEASPNYLSLISKAFNISNCDCAAIGFRHQNLFENQHILQYELFLRYYCIGLKLAGYPFWHQTIGSCMAVRAGTYLKYGGMNTRKAGEDFYFMHKLMPVAKTITISQAVNVLSDRISDKVPFGTGRAMQEALKYKNQKRYTYHPDGFTALRGFIQNAQENIHHIFTNSGPFYHFLEAENGLEDLRKIFKNFGNNQGALEKAVWQYLNGFKILRYFHWFRDKVQTNIPLDEALHLKLGSGNSETWLNKLIDLEQD